jgi:hypothetical protein
MRSQSTHACDLRWISVVFPLGIITAAGVPCFHSSIVLADSALSAGSCEQEIEEINKTLRNGGSRAEVVRHARLAAAAYRDLLRDRRNSSDTVQCGRSLARACRDEGLEALTAPNLHGYPAARELLEIFLEFFSQEPDVGIVEFWLGLALAEYAESGHPNEMDARNAWEEALRRLEGAAQRRNSYTVRCGGQRLPLSQAAARAHALAIAKLSNPFEPPSPSQPNAVSAIDTYLGTWKDANDWGHLRFRRSVLGIVASNDSEILDKLYALILDRGASPELRLIPIALFLQQLSESGTSDQKRWAERLANSSLRSLSSRLRTCIRSTRKTMLLKCIEDGKWAWEHLDQFALRPHSCVALEP